jgi:YD repeat-containing protein
VNSRTMNAYWRADFVGVCIAFGALVMSTNVAAEGPDQEPIPGFYQEPGLSPNRESLRNSSRERIDPFTGKLQWHFIDIAIPGNGGFDLKVQRSYSSRNEDYEPSPLGIGWSMHFGRMLRKAIIAFCDPNQNNASNNPVFEAPDGSRQVFYPAMDGPHWISANRWKADCAPGYFQMFSPDGTHYRMDVFGPIVGTTNRQASLYPSVITDRNGNTMTIEYTPLNGLTFGPKAVTASDGRRVDFTYLGGALTSVSDGTRSWSYNVTPIPNYVGAYNLTSATRPDGGQWQYFYNDPGSGPGTGTPGGFSMRKAIYPTGGEVNYEYEFVRFAQPGTVPTTTVITKKTAGSDIWDYTYRPAEQPLPLCNEALCAVDPVADALKLDKTTVLNPDGSTHVFQHVGYTSASNGVMFLIGTLLFKQTGDLQFDAYSWGGQQISNQVNINPYSLVFDSVTRAPVLMEKAVNRYGAEYRARFFQAGGTGFDQYGNPQQMVETGPTPGGGTQSRTTNYTYKVDPARWILHVRKDEISDTLGSILRTFDNNANMLTESRYGVDTTYTYTGAGDVATKTDARSNTITFSNYKRGVPQSESHPEAVNISRTVDGAGNVLSETDGANATTSYGYDGLNRITSITHPIGNPVTVSWGTNSRTLTRGAFTEQTTFDSFGRRTSVVHGSGTSSITQTFAYDALGRRTFASYPNSARGTSYVYNALNQLAQLMHDSLPGGVGATAGQAYGYSGTDVTFVNERNLEYLHKHRGWSDPDKLDLMEIVAPESSASITMDRNAMGQLTRATQDGKTREYRYDGRYFLTSTVEPEVGETIFGRDGVGNMTSRKVGAAVETTFEYDGRNRLKTITYPAGTPSVTRTYYKDDRLATVRNGVVSRDFIYDANKNLKAEMVLMVEGNLGFNTLYNYDGNDALWSMTYPSGKTLSFAPDMFGRPTKALPYVTTVEHHPTGQVSRMVYANGVETNVQFNNRNWPGSLFINKAGGSTYFSMAYGYEGNGNVSSIIDATGDTYDRTMTYDNIDRLATIIGPWGNGSLTYDGRGNIRSQNLGANFNVTYNYDPANDRLASTTGTKANSFSYDAYGNVTGNGTLSFGYNDASQMKCVKCGTPDEVSYQYDGIGLRSRTKKGTAFTHFVYDSGGKLLSERSSDGVLKDYFYLGGKQVAVWERRPNQ